MNTKDVAWYIIFCVGVLLLVIGASIAIDGLVKKDKHLQSTGGYVALAALLPAFLCGIISWSYQ